MNMESLTVTLETAKKLKAAGFPRDTACTWNHSASYWFVIGDAEIDDTTPPIMETIAAPTAQEIADQLPSGIDDEPLSLYKPDGNSWDASYSVKTSGVHNGPTMAEALAALYLKYHEVQS